MKKAVLLLLCILLLCAACSVAAASTLTLPADMVHIDDEAFMNDAFITSAVLPDSLQYIGQRAFAYTGLTSVNIPRTVSYISADAFLGCDSLVAAVYSPSYALDYCRKNGIAYEILPSDLIKVLIITLDPSESGYRKANVKDLQNTFTAENGYDAEFVTAYTMSAQLAAANRAFTENAEYVLICPAESTGWDDFLLNARAAGIRVFLYDRMINCDPSLYTAAVVSDMKYEGELAVSWLDSLNLPEYKILHIIGLVGSDAQIGRTEPVIDKCRYDRKWSIALQNSADWDTDQARIFTETAIRQGKSFNVIVAQNDSMALGAADALDYYGITHGVGGDVTILSYDGMKYALRKLLAGEWNAVVQCSAFQAGPLDSMIKTLESGGQITGLNELNQYINHEIVFDARTITEADVEHYGY